MTEWLNIFKQDPTSPLVNSKNEAIAYFARRDLLEKSVEPIDTLWELPAAQKVLRKQRADGSWKYPGKGNSSETNYDVFHTIKMLRQLVAKYELNKEHPAISKAVEYLLSFQTEDGDIREFYGTQYSPNYNSVAFENITKAEYDEDPRVGKFFQWILSICQDDGGWAIPMRTAEVKWQQAIEKPHPIMPIKSKPASNWVTDIVLRALSVHPKYRKSQQTQKAGTLLMSRFLKSDKYPDRRKSDYWTTFTYPFWWGDLLSSLNSLSLIGFTKNEPQIRKALDWFVDRQQRSGLWRERILMGGNDEDNYSWHSLAICRVFKRFYIID